jgi:hypothetical protein
MEVSALPSCVWTFTQQVVKKDSNTFRYRRSGSHLFGEGQIEALPEDLFHADDETKRSLNLAYGQGEILDLSVHEGGRPIDGVRDFLQVLHDPGQVFIEHLESHIHALGCPQDLQKKWNAKSGEQQKSDTQDDQNDF